MATRAPLLANSVADETTSLLTLTNGSTIECVPASMAQLRWAEADLLIVDEAGFVTPTDLTGLSVTLGAGRLIRISAFVGVARDAGGSGLVAVNILGGATQLNAWVNLGKLARDRAVQEDIDTHLVTLVGGDLLYTRLEVDKQTTRRVHTFDDSREEFARMVGGTDHPVALSQEQLAAELHDPAPGLR